MEGKSQASTSPGGKGRRSEASTTGTSRLYPKPVPVIEHLRKTVERSLEAVVR